MGNESHHHHQHHQHQLYHQKSTFLPMLCSRPSIKEVTLPRLRDQSRASGNDPLSPRISCMGQVKRNNKIATSHRFITFTTKTNPTTTSSSSSPLVKHNYSKLRKLFSAKNFIISTPKTTPSTSTISRQAVTKNRRSENYSNNAFCISIEEMDPPLPVVKKLEEPKEVDSLWKRRSGTARPALKSLQLQQIHHPRIYLQPPTV